MAQYVEDWSSFSVGATALSGFVKRPDALQNLLIESDAAAPSGKSLRITRSGTSSSFLDWTEVSADANRGTLDFLALVRANAWNSSTAAYTLGGLVGRADGNAGTVGLDGCYGAIGSDTGQSSSGAQLRYRNLVNNSGTLVKSPTTGTWTINTLYWLRLRLSGTTYIVSLYPYADPLGTPIDEMTGTATAAGGVDQIGLTTFGSAADLSYLYIAAGTNGDVPPLPSASVTPVAFSGAVSNQAGTEGSAFSLSLASYFSGTETPFVYSLQSGTLPAGLSLSSSTGAITGTPTTAGTSSGIVVRATDSASNTADTNSFSITIDAALSPPSSAPGSTVATAVSSSQINVSWAAVSGAEGYDIERDGEGTPLDLGNNLTYSHTGLAAESAHSYRVRAYNAAGDGPWSASFGDTTEAGLSITIDGSFDRSCVNPALSSWDADYGDGIPVIRIYPRRQTVTTAGSDVWLEPFARITGVDGLQPWITFEPFTRYGANGKNYQAWLSTQRAHYSYDGITWTPFGAPVISDNELRFRAVAAFAADVVYVARSWPRPVSRIGSLIESYATAHPTKVFPTASALTFTPSLTTSFPAQAYIAGEVAAKTNELGQAVPATPLYGFEINDAGSSGPKKLAVITAGIHSGEDVGEVWLWELIDYILNGASAQAAAIRAGWRILVYPLANPAGRYAGYYRGAPGSNVDPNREFATASPTHDCVSLLKSVIASDATDPVKWSIDFHAARNGGRAQLGVRTSHPVTMEWDTRVRALYGGTWTYYDAPTTTGLTSDVTIRGWMARDFAAPCPLLIETCDGLGSISPAVMRPYAEASVDALAGMDAEGWFDPPADLIVSSAAHTHTADSPTLSAGLTLVIQGASHPHSVDALALAAGLSLTPHGASHTHSADNAPLSAALVLSAADSLHTHGADLLTISAALSLAVQGASHSHAADNTTLTASAQAGDPHWASVIALLHFDGSDGSTNFVDEVGGTWSAAGSAQISAAQSRFGGASVKFQGNSDRAFRNSASLSLAAYSSWTLEMWVRPTQVENRIGLFFNGNTEWNQDRIQLEIVSGYLNLYIQGNTGTGASIRTPPGVITPGVWHHIAAVKDGSSVKVFVDGVLCAADTYEHPVSPSSSASIGITRSAGAIWHMDGYIDEVRITGGVARYLSSFSPPSAPFANFAGSAPADISVSSATHSHVADNLSLSATLTLAVQDSSHGHAAQALALSAALSLLVDSALHTQLADSLGLTSGTAANLSVDSASHAHLADALTLSGALSLVAYSATQGHLSDQAMLTAAHGLVVQNAAHGHLADAVDASTGLALTILDAFHAHTADSLDADTALSLAVHDALHTHAAEATALTAALTLIVSDAIHSHFADRAEFFIPEPLLDQLRRSVFLRIARQHAVVRTQDQRVFGRVERSGVFLKGR